MSICCNKQLIGAKLASFLTRGITGATGYNIMLYGRLLFTGGSINVTPCRVCLDRSEPGLTPCLNSARNMLWLLLCNSSVMTSITPETLSTGR